MVERRVCTFCGNEIEPGTGRMYVKKDGVTYQFCTSKCYKNMVELKRVPRRTTWTSWYAREKQVRLKGAEPEPAQKKTRKVRPSTKSKEPAPAKVDETAAMEATPAEPEAVDEPEATKGDE
jgi:large subunit ribosomal protein L24e